MRTEHEEQVAFIDWANHWLNGIDAFVFAIPNGGKRHIRSAMKFKAEGVVAGIPDLFLCHARNGYHGLFIEMKAKKGRISAKQKEIFPILEKQGYKVVVCYGAVEAMKAVRNYMI